MYFLNTERSSSSITVLPNTFGFTGVIPAQSIDTGLAIASS